MPLHTLPPFSRPAFVAGLVACLFTALAPLGAWAQAAAATPPPASLSTPIVALDWKDLSTVQRQSLQPLEAAWPNLSNGQRRKWIAIAKNYPQLGPAEQTKMHGRMAEWAALKPRDREMARLNFAEVKKVTPEQRAANWEAYKALTPEEKSRLAKKTPAKPAGAAVSAKLAPTSKLTPVPVTRLSPEADRARFTAQQAIDPNTLLPVMAPSN